MIIQAEKVYHLLSARWRLVKWWYSLVGVQRPENRVSQWYINQSQSEGQRAVRYQVHAWYPPTLEWAMYWFHWIKWECHPEIPLHTFPEIMFKVSTPWPVKVIHKIHHHKKGNKTTVVWWWWFLYSLFSLALQRWN